MVLKKCDEDEFFRFNDKKILLWGKGQALRNIENRLEKNDFYERISYIVDRDTREEVFIKGRKIPVFHKEKILEETDCIVLVISTKFFVEIYEELLELNLPDSVECYFWAFSRMIQSQDLLNAGKRLLQNKKNEIVPRTIHTFWFSGDPLPEEYQKCLNSWKKYCPDYEIKIWNQETYDCNKNQFVKDAIAARKWAFAADVARLDVLYKYGGIYMDLDVEIFQPLDDMLCHNGVFFHLEDCIDMPVFSSVKGNEILKKIKNLYIDLEFSQDEDYQKNVLIQPRFVRSAFETEGVPMEEGVHKINGNLYLPRNMFLPLYWFDWSGKSKCGDAGYGIHHCNAGWFSDSTREERNQKIKRIAKLWDEIYQ